MKIIFSRNDSFGSKLIRALTRGAKFSHCGLVVGDRVAHSTALKGVHFVDYGEFLSKNEVATIEIESNEELLEEYLQKHVGYTDYDFGFLKGFFKNSKAENNPSKMWCVEFILGALVYCGHPQFAHKDIAKSTAFQLYQQVLILRGSNA